MSEKVEYIIMPNGMRIKKRGIEPEKANPIDIKQNDIDSHSKTSEANLQYRIIAESKPRVNVQRTEPVLNNKYESISKITKSTFLSKSEANQSIVDLNKRSKLVPTNNRNQNNLKSKRIPKSVAIPNSITAGRYIQFKNTRELYKVIGRDTYSLRVQDSNHRVSTLKFTKDVKDLICIVSDLHIAVLKKEATSIDAIKEELLNAPIKNSIEIIKATGLKPNHYGLMKPYLVPSILNLEEWDVWNSRLRHEIEGRRLTATTKVNEIAKANHMLIKPQDFVVMVHTFSCSSKGHKLDSIQAEVLTNAFDGKNLSSITLPAGYCRQCKRYFILSTIFEENLMHLKQALCDFVKDSELNSYLQRHNQNSHEFSAQSILNRCGYSVSRTNHLSRIERTQLLESIIAHGVLSREEVKSFINWLIRFHGANPIMDGALIEWKIDLLAIAQGRKSNVVLVKRICT